MTTRTYKTADEALEAANKEVARLQYEWDMQRYSVFGVPIDKNRLNVPTQFAYKNSDWEAVGVDRDGSIKPVEELTYLKQPKITIPEPAHPLLDFPSVYASIQIEG